MGYQTEIFDARDLISFPDGDNDTDTVFGNVHFNLTTLKHFNYTHYDNGTLSNGTKCYLTFEPYQPVLLLNNGTFINATKCYTAIEDISTRGYFGIGFAVFYAVALVLTLTCLTKHGKSYLPREKRFYPVGRRWQWYWALFVCACALISLFVNVDVDRYYLPELPITVTCFFWFLICQGTMALVWEAVRHWGSWQERQYIDPNPFELRQDDRRAMCEFWMPLWFYLWVWLNFFMVVPRSWTFSQLQRSPDQTAAKAIPAATGIRFKIGGFMLVIAWLTICFSLRHSIQYYKPRNRGLVNRGVGFVRAMPFRFMLLIPLCASMIAYQILISFVWDLSIIRYHGIVPVQYFWGYGPPLLILLIQAAYGIATPNEDRQLIQQRRIRGEAVDRELGLVKKPAWWRRIKGENLSMRDKIARNVHEVGGGRATGRRVEDAMERQAREEAERAARDDDIEMQPYHGRPEDNPRADRAGVRTQPSYATQYSGKSGRRREERTMEVAAGILFPNDTLADRARREAELGLDGPAPPPYRDEVDRGRQSSHRPGSGGRSNSAETTNSLSAQPQQVRSMLDV